MPGLRNIVGGAQAQPGAGAFEQMQWPTDQRDNGRYVNRQMLWYPMEMVVTTSAAGLSENGPERGIHTADDVPMPGWCSQNRLQGASIFRMVFVEDRRSWFKEEAAESWSPETGRLSPKNHSNLSGGGFMLRNGACGPRSVDRRPVPGLDRV